MRRRCSGGKYIVQDVNLYILWDISSMLYIRGWCGTLKRVVWYFEDGGVVLWRGCCGTIKRVLYDALYFWPSSVKTPPILILAYKQLGNSLILHITSMVYGCDQAVSWGVNTVKGNTVFMHGICFDRYSIACQICKTSFADGLVCQLINIGSVRMVVTKHWLCQVVCDQAYICKTSFADGLVCQLINIGSVRMVVTKHCLCQVVCDQAYIRNTSFADGLLCQLINIGSVRMVVTKHCLGEIYGI